MVSKTTFDPNSIYLDPSLEGFQGQVAPFKNIVEVICKTESTSDVSLLKVHLVQLKGFEALAISTQNNSANKEDISSSLANAKNLLLLCKDLIASISKDTPSKKFGLKSDNCIIWLAWNKLETIKKCKIQLNKYIALFNLKLSQISQENRPKETRKKQHGSCNASMIYVSFAILAMAAVYLCLPPKF